MWSSKVHRHLLLRTGRNISLTAAVSENHYDVLGITPKATQAEVKAAYYKLSKLHHPDISSNKDGESGDQFRLISEAYEILGNYRSRQLYDRGLYGHSRRTQENNKDSTRDHPKMSFYKSRFDKSRVPTAQMKKGVYDFDEWTRQHYSETFAKVTAASKLSRKHGEQHIDPREIISNEGILKLSVVAVCTVIVGFALMELSSSTYDTPKPFRENSNKPS